MRTLRVQPDLRPEPPLVDGPKEYREQRVLFIRLDELFSRSGLDREFFALSVAHRKIDLKAHSAGVLRVPRPVHEKRGPVKAEAFKRNFFGKLMALPVTGKKPVKVWFDDESRYGLLPNLRRVWTKKGLRPHKKWQSKYEFSYCYGAIDPVEGRTVFLQTPSVNLEWTQAFLEQIKKTISAV